MTGESYELALTLAHNDIDLLEDVHETIMGTGISDETYAKIFSLMYGGDDDLIRYFPSEKVWRRNGQQLSDMKVFTALDKTCELIRAYVLASWENCVFSAWVPRKEVQKAEEKMDTQESIAHAKAILSLAAETMASESSGSPKIDWAADEDGGAE